jgi:hypothetical protein
MPTTLNRSLLVTLIPGVIAISPWVLVLLQHTDVTLGLDKYPAIGYVLLFAAATVAGSFFEGITSFVESRWDHERECEFALYENWTTYLASTFDNEPVGYRYLARRAITLYFELAMMCATPIFVIGAGVLSALRFPEYQFWFSCATVAVAIIGVVYFRIQARATHELLCKTRRDINARLHLQANQANERNREDDVKKR